MSSEISCSRAFEAEEDPVAVVERIRGTQDVYDIQVEGTSCFFANGLLAHNCAIIDDPLRSREDADSELNRNKQWEWFKGDLSPRLKPGARIVLIQCMTGDTPVMLADGSEKSLREIRPGEKVATYRNGILSTSFVRNWTSNGIDRVFTIKMISGITVKANERHPFLVYEGGEPKWVKTRDLRQGHEIFRVKRENGKGRHVLGRGAESPLNVAATARLTITRKDGRTAFGLLPLTLSRIAIVASNIATGLLSRNITTWLSSKVANALYVGSLPAKMFEPIGAESFASITATTRTKFEAFFATIATSPSATQKQQTPLSPSPYISDFILDRIAEVKDAGIEEVFDIQIDQTENFIANGLVSHNTRWHEDDLAGRILEEAKRTGRTWRVISLPAVAEADDLLGRKPGEYLWDDAYGYGQTLRDAEREQSPRNWSALYQQRPAPETGDYFKEEWLRPYVTAPDLKTLTVYGGSDFAVTSNGGDYTVHMVVGIDPEDKPWLLDLWRGQTASDEWVDAWCDLSKLWKPNGWAFEQGQIKSGVGPFLHKRARERKCWTDMRDFPTRGDKAVRAQSMRGRMAMLGLGVPIGKPWYPALRSELLSFPAGKHDDQVDALGLVGQLLDIMGSGRKRTIDDLKWDHTKDSYRLPSTEIPSDNFKVM